MAEPPRAELIVTADEIVDAERAPRFLQLRRIALCIEAEGGWRSEPGVWDFVERPAGLDAVVVVVYRRLSVGVEVLLRRGLRVPAAVGRPGQPRGAGRHPAVFVEEVVAGLVEAGEDDAEGLVERARAEVEEETGLRLARDAFSRLGGPLWATPGLCAEVLHYFAAEATLVDVPLPPSGDGSPFEALSSIAWYPLDEAIARVCGLGRASGDIAELGDLRAELGLRRLAEHLGRSPR